MTGRDIHLMIATPVGRDPKAGHVLSLINTVMMLKDEGIKFVLRWATNSSDVAYVRNQLADDFLQDEQATHVLWIDDDIAWNPADVLRLIDSGLDMVGGAYRKRAKDADPFTPFGWAFQVATGRYPEQRDNAFEVDGAGFGFLLISKQVFRDIIAKHQLTEIVRRSWRGNMDAGKPRRIWQFFKFDGDESEDIHFCRLAREAGHKVWLLPDINLKHYGDYAYDGSLADFAEKHDEAKPCKPLLTRVKDWLKSFGNS